MKLVVISPHHYPSQSAGAIRLKSFIDEWVKSVDLHLITDKDSLQLDNRIQYTKSFFKVICNKSSFPARLIREILFGFFIFIKLIFIRYDVAFISSPPFFPMFFLSLISICKRKPYILDVRDLYPEVLFDYKLLNKKGLIGKILTRMEEFIYDHSQFIFTVTEKLQQDIDTRTIKEVYLMRNGIVSEKYTEATVKYKYFTIVFHGTLGKFQDVKLILDYARFLKKNNNRSIKIIIIGDGPKEEEILNGIAQCELQDIVQFLGHKTNDEIMLILGQCHLGISPRVSGKISETAFPVKVYEYLGAGLPVICSPIGEASVFLEKHNTGFGVESGDLTSFIACINRLITDDKLYHDYCKNAKRMSVKFDRKRVAQSALKLILNNED